MGPGLDPPPVPAACGPRLVPALLKHKSGLQEWVLSGNILYVGGLLPDLAAEQLAADLRASAEQAGGTVLRCFIKHGNYRGHVGHLELISARQAAMVLERLQHCRLHGRSLFFRPDREQVQIIQALHPQEASAAEHARIACQAGAPPPPHPSSGEQQQWQRQQAAQWAVEFHSHRSTLRRLVLH
ncbi:hypothetical protein ABPG77_005869 [Micractinium sp. CCAP 211/92]